LVAYAYIYFIKFIATRYRMMFYNINELKLNIELKFDNIHAR